MTEDRNQMGAVSAQDPFGVYRAEWLNDAIYQLFAKPTYYPELETHRPCVLIGGRGTGKTTVLRCLSYDGKFALDGNKPSLISTWRYYGFYYRVNTNRVTAFRGSELNEEQWTKAFAHYINLLLCGQVLSFLEWYSANVPGFPQLDGSICSAIAEGLFLEDSRTQKDLMSATVLGRQRFENFLNNVGPNTMPPMSIQGQPIDQLCSELLKLPQFKGKSFFFIVDEFENFLDYQQVVMNTLIKHCGEAYTFKIGVRELGWRTRTTLNPNEQLISPADYERIDISQRLDSDNFYKFAEEVCNLRALQVSDFPSGLDIIRVFSDLSIDQEAELLGVNDHMSSISSKLEAEGVSRADIENVSPLELYFISYWSETAGTSMRQTWEARITDASSWSVRYNNYKVAILFRLRAGKSGIKKYYAGWHIYVRLADGNIRYLLELVGQARQLHQRSGGSSGAAINPEIQTRAAILVGRKNLAELEGLSVYGAQLTKLLLSLGRVFEVLASQPENHAPELTQFHLPDDAPLGDDAARLLSAAVMHLALVRSVSNKRMDTDLKSYDYAIHPIFAPFFVFSHRRKRKMRISPHQLIALIENPRGAIRQLLRQRGRTGEYPLPEQMQLFEGFYNDPS